MTLPLPHVRYDFSRFSEIVRQHETGIYALVNRLRDRVYVGATKRSFRERWDGHRMALESRTHFNLPLQHDWLRDGSNHFAFLILDELPVRLDMAHFEQSWIDGFRAARVDCYNSAQATEGVLLPLPPSIALPADQEWLVVEEVANSLRVSVRTVLRWITAHDMDAVFLHGRYRVSLESLRQFMNRDRPRPAPRVPGRSRTRSRLSLCDIVVYDRQTHRVDQIAGHRLAWNDRDGVAVQRLKTVLSHIGLRQAATITDADQYQPGEVFRDVDALLARGDGVEVDA